MLLPRALKGADLVLYSVFKSLGIQIDVVPVIMEDDYKGDDYEEDEYEGDDSDQSEKEQDPSEKEQGASEKEQGASEKEQGASEKEQGKQRHPKRDISLVTSSSARWRQATFIYCH
jgi:AAA ATPase containing von Willebrand factor type A (vWA) domain